MEVRVIEHGDFKEFRRAVLEGFRVFASGVYVIVFVKQGSDGN
jgi:hypothetical protein